MQRILMRNGKKVQMDELAVCPKCGKPTERYVELPMFDGTKNKRRMKVHVMCPCEQAELKAYEAELQKEEELRAVTVLRQVSLMDSKLRGARLKTFKQTEDNARLHKIVCRYIENFEEMYKRNQGLLLYGDVGCGKSYAAAVIANELLEKKIPVIMTSFVKLLEKAENFERNSEELDRLKQAKLLIIDDLGAERSTEFALEKVYKFIDDRYTAKKPLILTSNLTLDDMKACEDIKYSRIYDRIFEMCYPVHVKGFSWRKRQANERYMDTKRILEG